MIKHLFSFILSTIILININAFSMDEMSASKDIDKNKAVLKSMDIQPFNNDIFFEETSLVTHSQFAALVFFKIFIQAPIEMIDGSMKMASILIKPTVSFSIDSDSVLEEFYPIKKET